MYKMILLLVLTSNISKAGDTLFTHPHYPPLVYYGDDYNFYKYTPKYIPKNLLHCFKILGTTDSFALERFINRSKEEVIERGIFDHGYRIRKEFCLKGYNSFTMYFHNLGIYSPFCMETYILLSFHQYLKKEKITWNRNKKTALENRKKDNKKWKKRARKLYKKTVKKPKKNKNQYNEHMFKDETNIQAY